jgi:ectoine hydroxylase-related dioxygenase (phytanoyl-CoA dioxygenase family)
MTNRIVDAVTPSDVTDYQNNGVVVLRGVFKDWIPALSRGADYHDEHPSPNALVHNRESHKGRFLEDFCCWQHIPEYKDFVYNSPMGAVAAKLMGSSAAQFFHDHYLYKEASSGVPTPWHQDMPYYCVEGDQTASFWIPLNTRAQEVSLRCAAGTHTLPREIRPTSWSTMKSFYEDDSKFMDMPDIEDGSHDIKVWAMAPGDAVAFNFKTIHGANANTDASVNRTLSFRLVGDDAHFLQRPGRTSPDFPDINQKTGERLREDWFPVVWNEIETDEVTITY